MMAVIPESIFLGMSKSEIDDKQVTIDTICTTAFALYKCTKESSSESSPSAGDSVARSASVSSDSREKRPQYSTEKLLSSLEGADDTELDRFVRRKLYKGTVQHGSGSISAVDLYVGQVEPQLFLSYYCLLKPKDLEIDLELDLELEELGLGDGKTQGSTSSSGEGELLVCLIAPANSQLDLFKPDLDKFSSRLYAKLNKLDDLEPAKSLLESWFESCTSYISNTVQALGPDIRYLIHTAVADRDLDLQCGNEELKASVERFMEVCSLSELLSVESSDELPESTGSTDLLLDISPQQSTSSDKSRVSVKLKIDGDWHKFENEGCTKYCEDWSLALESCESHNHPQLRHVIENYKLKTIQDMNTLNRLLKQAEFDFYALYRCCIFLNQSGNSSILMKHGEQQLQKCSQADTQDILQVLQEYMANKYPLMPR